MFRLLTQYSDVDLSQCSQNDSRAKEIMSTLKNNKQGLKTYLFKNFKDTDVPIINTLFDYAKNIHGDVLTTITKTQAMRARNMAKTFGFEFWSTSDLVNHTFKYLDLKNLNTCSYVCSIWMYHAMNPLCINCYSHDSKTHKNIKSMHRTLQRFSQTKHLNIQFPTSWKENIEFDFIASLKRLTILDIDISYDLLPTLIKALNAITSGIKMICVKCTRGYYQTTTTFKKLCLPQAQHVRFQYSSSSSNVGVFPFIISNQCQTLFLRNVIISHLWCEKVVESINQDFLSNLHVLMMENVTIELSTVNVAAKLFSNINHLRLNKIRTDMLELWLGMKNYIYDNNIQVIIERYQKSESKQKDEIVSRFTLLQFMKKNWLQCNHYYDVDGMDDNANYIYNSQHKHPIVSVDNVLKHICQNIEFLTLVCRSKVLVGTDIFKIKFPKLKRLVLFSLAEIPMNTIAQLFKFVDHQYDYNNECFFNLDIKASICNLKSNIQEYYIKLLFTLIAKWIKQHALIHLKLKCVAVASTSYDVVAVETAKREFTKMYNQLFVPILRSLVNIKLDNDCSSLATFASYLAQPIISYEVKDWKNAYDTRFKTFYQLNVLTAQEQETSELLMIFAHPNSYWECVEKLMNDSMCQ